MSKETKTQLIDLAAETNGGRVLLASDEFFAPKENLLKAGRGEFIPEKYTDRGKWMDGWETRRKRAVGNDWCVLRLGKPGIISKLDIDTNHFVGNYPAQASVDACHLPQYASFDTSSEKDHDWSEILPKSELQGDTQNIFTIKSDKKFTHLRLNIFPDGGIARLKVYGHEQAIEDEKQLFDAVAVENGGATIACSDMHFGNMQNLIKPGNPVDMSDGWETKRRRGSGHDWAILKLGAPCIAEIIVIDTLHFKGNFPDSCSVDGCFSLNADADSIQMDDVSWNEILPETKLKGNSENIFHKQLQEIGQCTHVKLNIYPDGGVSRLRILGRLIS